MADMAVIYPGAVSTQLGIPPESGEKGKSKPLGYMCWDGKHTKPYGRAIAVRKAKAAKRTKEKLYGRAIAGHGATVQNKPSWFEEWLFSIFSMAPRVGRKLYVKMAVEWLRERAGEWHELPWYKHVLQSIHRVVGQGVPGPIFSQTQRAHPLVEAEYNESTGPKSDRTRSAE